MAEILLFDNQISTTQYPQLNFARYNTRPISVSIRGVAKGGDKGIYPPLGIWAMGWLRNACNPQGHSFGLRCCNWRIFAQICVSVCATCVLVSNGCVRARSFSLPSFTSHFAFYPLFSRIFYICVFLAPSSVFWCWRLPPTCASHRRIRENSFPRVPQWWALLTGGAVNFGAKNQYPFSWRHCNIRFSRSAPHLSRRWSGGTVRKGAASEINFSSSNLTVTVKCLVFDFCFSVLILILCVEDRVKGSLTVCN